MPLHLDIDIFHPDRIVADARLREFTQKGPRGPLAIVADSRGELA